MNSVNNLNIFTFIKDIYQSLKNIDKSLTLSNDALNKRITKLEDNQQILIDKLTNIESVLNRLGEMNKPNSGLDKNIEFELLEKMKRLNQNEMNNSKLSLKPEELTFANILENSYSFTDINESIIGNEWHNLNSDNMNDNREDIINESNNSINNNSIESLDTLLF
jgi:hypothetical protein